jgi:hypothetical protein
MYFDELSKIPDSGRHFITRSSDYRIPFIEMDQLLPCYCYSCQGLIVQSLSIRRQHLFRRMAWGVPDWCTWSDATVARNQYYRSQDTMTSRISMDIEKKFTDKFNSMETMLKDMTKMLSSINAKGSQPAPAPTNSETKLSSNASHPFAFTDIMKAVQQYDGSTQHDKVGHTHDINNDHDNDNDDNNIGPTVSMTTSNMIPSINIPQSHTIAGSRLYPHTPIMTTTIRDRHSSVTDTQHIIDQSASHFVDSFVNIVKESRLSFARYIFDMKPRAHAQLAPGELPLFFKREASWKHCCSIAALADTSLSNQSWEPFFGSIRIICSILISDWNDGMKHLAHTLMRAPGAMSTTSMMSHAVMPLMNAASSVFNIDRNFNRAHDGYERRNNTSSRRNNNNNSNYNHHNSNSGGNYNSNNNSNNRGRGGRNNRGRGRGGGNNNEAKSESKNNPIANN